MAGAVLLSFTEIMQTDCVKGDSTPDRRSGHAADIGDKDAAFIKNSAECAAEIARTTDYSGFWILTTISFVTLNKNSIGPIL